jgi:NAD(P)-dependent dehydrogenase (short-subunit alcohol dehydrogenase family)
MKKEDILGLFDVTGKAAIVTGASGSFGSTAARALAGAGAKVMLTDRNVSKLEEIAKEITDDGGIALLSEGDSAVPDDVCRVISACVDAFGSIDILVTAAGINTKGLIHEQPVDQWQMVMDTNVKGTYLFCKEAGKVMMSQGKGGKVILVGSVRGSLGMADNSAYSPSKGAVHLLAKTLGCEWGVHRINVNCIAPAVFRSEITQAVYDDPVINKMILGRIPIGRLGEPEDFIGAVLFLSSRASDWMTGSVMYVDGGYTAG